MYKDVKSSSIKLPYRLGVGMMILNKDNKVFVGQRVDTKVMAWQMPQGGIDIGETPSSAAMREMIEEIGTNNAKIIVESKYWYTYSLPKILIPRLWNGQFKGQQQRWFLIRFLGEDSEINLNYHKAEFTAWKWIDVDTLLKVIVPFKRKLYKAVIKEFSSFI